MNKPLDGPPTDPLHTSRHGPLADTRGGLRLVGGTRHLTGRVEAWQDQTQRQAPPVRWRAATQDPAQSRSGQAHGGLSGARDIAGLDGLIRPFDKAPGAGLAAAPAAPRRDALVSALNGVLGDHLLRSDHPLAIPLQLRQGGRVLVPAALGKAAPRCMLLLVHGLCISDFGWCRNGHDHGALLGRVLGAAPVYAWYNSGLHVSVNGRSLADALERLVQDWPTPLDELFILGHNMGGLVARSACRQAEQAGQHWPERLRKLVFLGTPHQGAPLERAGHWLHRVMDLSPCAAPFSRLSRLRSEGLTDLCHGKLLDADWQGAGRSEHRDLRVPVPLPAGVDCYAIAGTAGGPGSAGSLRGDGLVRLASALGHHKRAALDLGLPQNHTWVGHGIRHLDLLSDPAVYRRLLGWLGP